MEQEYVTSLIRLLAAVLAGGIIGLERTFHGRPAGFRTHTLVCMASTLLMLLTVYQWQLLKDVPIETIRVDPTRMAQGIMTGIGFLGAGVIMREQLTIRGLTTAASIWITASIGILIGMGFYAPSAMATVLAVGVLSTFRWIESKMSTLHYGRLSIRFRHNDYPTKQELVELIESRDFSAATPSFHLNEEGKTFEYRMTIRTRRSHGFERLSEEFSALERVTGFDITPIGD